ncbi:glycosyl hydrolase family 65 protein [Anaerocolumna sp. AGMB13020]|uniref:glycosyl hydrolase family 65 protein n=1 Tax=Anaerocolumna sp. AGMB13020 TaxID=3081750 RepID=UPI0029537B2F|nr:glycosyl hydrolase family 65 protein [Anaerocolumna sp. AGMB13020]WOO36257.1 glycosyl hydrolase family 65 protein [Anaerocolumna sp. AGMB13020]
MNWNIEELGYQPEKATGLGNKFLIGNGYMGIRGTLEESKKDQFPAVNLSGIYDQVGNGWREPLNAPNGLFTRLLIEGKEYCLSEKEHKAHTMELDYRHGIFRRETVFEAAKGTVTLKTERFASMVDKHLIALKVTLVPSYDGEIEVITGIDGEVWDINGPHYDSVLTGVTGELIGAVATTHEKQDKVAVYEALEIPSVAGQEAAIAEQSTKEKDRTVLRHLKLQVTAEKSYTFFKYISIYTSLDTAAFQEEGKQLVLEAKKRGYEALLKEHKNNWEKKWSRSEVEIEGDDEAMEALNYSLYHLHSIAPRHSKSLSIAARGLSGQTYKGAVFWDTEMFMLDFFLFTEPEVAKTLLKYRIDTLKGAKAKAGDYGFCGAFYAWESQEGGYDACSDYNVTDVFTGRPMRTYFKDKQIHISTAVVYGIMRYIEFTGDKELLSEGGAETIIECAKFYYSLLIKRVKDEKYELYDVIGPDEYHERVNNNAYTNRMVKFTFEAAIKLLEEETENKAEAAEKTLLLESFRDAALHLYIPQPDEKTGIIEQFDGYEQLEDVSVEAVKGRLLHEKEYWGGAYGVASHTKVIKQADVVTMMNLFSSEYDMEILYKNWAYYEPRTEHGSSLSACMYSMVACKCNMPDQAYPFFLKSAKADLGDGGKQWAGLIYIGGTHPAASGGAYMTAVEGFAGLKLENGELKAEPRLPKGWKHLKFKVQYLGELYQVTVTKDKAEVEKIRD